MPTYPNSLIHFISLKRPYKLYYKAVIIALAYSSLLALNNLFIKPLEVRIGIYIGLLNITTLTQSLNVFIFARKRNDIDYSCVLP